MKENEDFIQKKRVKVRGPELRQKAKAKVVEQKDNKKAAVSPEPPANTKVPKKKNQQKNKYPHLSEAFVSLVFVLAFLFVFISSLSWLRRYGIVWDLD